MELCVCCHFLLRANAFYQHGGGRESDVSQQETAAVRRRGRRWLVRRAKGVARQVRCRTFPLLLALCTGQSDDTFSLLLTLRPSQSAPRRHSGRRCPRHGAYGSGTRRPGVASGGARLRLEQDRGRLALLLLPRGLFRALRRCFILLATSFSATVHVHGAN
jgi:hypothetical protein